MRPANFHMKPPPHVAIVLPPFVRLGSLDPARHDDLMGRGFAIERDDFGYHAVRFKDTGGDLLCNKDFVEIFQRLNDAGLAFQEDVKQLWSPADFMRELQSSGTIGAPFTAISWRGADKWFTTVYEPPIKTPGERG
jgi:hypothetical protein